MRFVVFFLIFFVFIGCGSEKKEPSKANVVKVSLKIEGMVCSSCEKSIESKLAKLDGVQLVEVSQESGEAEVEFDASKVSEERLIAEIDAIGYKACAKTTQR
ncbi:MAG: cation transporter [Chloroherpetonaceae bacterium]|nr:cation transporter [Chloroherpetonaceae bacterium]MDW8437220.1 heavy-metal-associated domain-containing protein [Chloroherpetonaceae bacterium]